ncbi:MAG: UDP-N-acetylglucosamine transferase subunit [Bogoriella megaspora]|nr:MAG: UDP-N-acetylglucosamine transferase subunit [Bogoriella megaspora]
MSRSTTLTTLLLISQTLYSSSFLIFNPIKPLSFLYVYHLGFLFLLLIYQLVTLVTLLPSHRPRPTPRHRRSTPTRLLIVLGSGGHTAEMLAMLQKVRLEDYSYRSWVVSSGDEVSAKRVVEVEHAIKSQHRNDGAGGGTYANGLERLEKSSNGLYDIKVLPRARRIHQSLLTTPLSCLWTLVKAFPVLLQPEIPDLILVNGPATATIVVFASLVLRFFNIRGCNSRGKMRTVYVESWARVKRLSLSGWLLCGVVDRCLVQWDGLEGKKGLFGGRAEYLGTLV